MKQIKRLRTTDVAIQYRMPSGFPGDVNRTHPVDILPRLSDPTNPPTLPGQGVIIDSTSKKIRKLITGDGTGSLALAGITVRTYPFQQALTGSSAANNYGAVDLGATLLPVAGEVDIMTRGYMMVQVPAGQSPQPGGAVYIWNAASSGVHVQGSFEATASAGNTATVSNAVWSSEADANGLAEIAYNI